MPIDLAQVDWLYVSILALFALVASYIANLVSFNRRGIGAVLTAVLFAAAFVFWTYYPHGLSFLPTSIAGQKSTASSEAPAPATPQQKPSNPVTDITPPANPAH